MYNAKNLTEAQMTSKGLVVDGATIKLQCNQYFFHIDSIDNNSFISEFTVKCSSDGSWLGLVDCVQPSCGSLVYDDTNVEQIVFGPQEYSWSLVQFQLTLLGIKIHALCLTLPNLHANFLKKTLFWGIFSWGILTHSHGHWIYFRF